MEKGFKFGRLRSALPVALMALGWLSASVVIVLPGRTQQNALAPEVQRRVATVILAQRIRAYAAMAQAHSRCLVRQGTLSASEAVQALNITLRDLGIDPVVLKNPLVEAVSPRFQGLLGANCGLDPKQEQEAQALLRNEL